MLAHGQGLPRAIDGQGFVWFRLHPEDTDLVPDTSPRLSHARLYFGEPAPPIAANGFQSLDRPARPIDVMPYQLDPALQALSQNRHRILLADAVGLGKTIEVGVLLSELIRRGIGILVVTTRAMMTQFEKEMWSRFTYHSPCPPRPGRHRAHTPGCSGDPNPFHYFDKTIISGDTFKQERDFRVHVEKSYWDVIDEEHKVGQRGESLVDAFR